MWQLSAGTLYVSQGSLNPRPPYATWATAATDIQEAVNAAAAGDTVVVTNGTYLGGIEVAMPLTLLSVNGPQSTIINGGGTNRCVWMTTGANLSGFTLTNGSSWFGGGALGGSTNAFLTNCVIVGNWANGGGGAANCTLYSCMLSANLAGPAPGGGAEGCTLYNCYAER